MNIENFVLANEMQLCEFAFSRQGLEQKNISNLHINNTVKRRQKQRVMYEGLNHD